MQWTSDIWMISVGGLWVIVSESESIKQLIIPLFYVRTSSDKSISYHIATACCVTFQEVLCFAQPVQISQKQHRAIAHALSSVLWNQPSDSLVVHLCGIQRDVDFPHTHTLWRFGKTPWAFNRAFPAKKVTHRAPCCRWHSRFTIARFFCEIHT